MQSILPLLQALDGATLSPQSFAAACASAGWPKPVDDGIGLWEVEHPDEELLLVLDTSMQLPTLICRLEPDNDHDADDLLKRGVRRKLDASFDKALATLRACFGSSSSEGTCEPPYHWRFVHFRRLHSVIALEQSDYDPAMGLQIVLLLQPSADPPHQTAITSEW